MYIDHTKRKLENMEKRIKSPIERIAYIELADEFDPYIITAQCELVPQKEIGNYRVDFYLSYKSSSGLVEFIIECDGHAFHEKTKEQVTRDKKRDRFFTQNGYVVLRYSGSEILKNPGQITSDIYEVMVRKDGF
jgi:very-short-patch-repair endonuclease